MTDTINFNFDSIRDRIHQRLLSSEWHAEKLKNLVKVNVVADIWLTWYVDLSDLFGKQSISAVTYAMLKGWSVTLNELKNAARANDAGSYNLKSIGEIVGLMMDTPAPDLAQMYILSNDTCFFGSAGVLDEDMQAKLDEIFPDGCYILPSSVNEVIAVSGDLNPDELSRLVFIVNRDQVAESDRLSDHVFKFNENGQLTVAG